MAKYRNADRSGDGHRIGAKSTAKRSFKSKGAMESKVRLMAPGKDEYPAIGPGWA